MSEEATRSTVPLGDAPSTAAPDLVVRDDLLEPLLGEATVGTPHAPVWEPASATLAIDDDGD